MASITKQKGVLTKKSAEIAKCGTLEPDTDNAVVGIER